MTAATDKCPRCGGPTECDEVDVGPGTIQGPRGCPACFWVEGDDLPKDPRGNPPISVNNGGTVTEPGPGPGFGDRGGT